VSATPGYDAGIVIVEKLRAAGITATNDPRSATPPCVLVTPPNKERDVGCGFTASWQMFILSPGTGNADAWLALDRLDEAVAAVLPARRSTFIAYNLSADNPSLPAYRVEFDEGV
jgi:hypothetical protein